jgi:hypothetical protein
MTDSVLGEAAAMPTSVPVEAVVPDPADEAEDAERW